MSGVSRNLGYWLLLLAALISLAYNLDYTGGGFGSSSIPPLKYLPYALAALAWGMLALGMHIRFSLDFMAILVLMLLMLGGSLYGLIGMHRPVEETYLGRALGLFVFLAAYWLGMDSYFRYRFLRVIIPWFIAIALVMAILVFLFRARVVGVGLTQVYHADVTMYVSAVFALALMIRRRVWLRWFLVTVIVAAGLLNMKTTGFLVTFMAIGMMIFQVFVRLRQNKRLDRALRFGLVGAAAVIILVMCLFLVGISFILLDQRLDARGDDEVRGITMLMRWNEFVSSPWYGSAFTASPLLEFGRLHTLVIPSHSDILDLSAFGGALAIFLFFVPLVRICVDQFDPSNQESYFFVFILMSFMLVMLVNPVLAQPRLAFWFFFSMGLLAANQKLRKSGKIFFHTPDRICPWIK